ncbi:MAG: Choline-sulfatase [Candidatus Ozemobacter sibiricus]|uniref:Choline-sulfatase n=1 Tax=Candidatus Ozemobacter sibiricus TaxID=2268124 RepID=A0A367ZSP5_9BACT|nr:MAG: Choline-sulfatase [Candidatus Ozemobacter sibiricus]
MHLACGLLVFGLLQQLTPDRSSGFSLVAAIFPLPVWALVVGGVTVLAGWRWPRAFRVVLETWPGFILIGLVGQFLWEPELAWWLLAMGWLVIWGSWRVQHGAVGRWPRLAPVLVVATGTATLWLYVDLQLYLVLRVHLNLELIGLFFSTGTTGPGVGLDRTLAWYLAWPLLGLALFGVWLRSWRGHPVALGAAWRARPLWGGLTFLVALVGVWRLAQPCLEARPFHDYLQWRMNNRLFPLPQPEAFRHPALQRAIAETRPFDRARMVRQGRFRRRDSRPLPHLVFLFVESWRPDVLSPDIMPKLTARAAHGLWLANHYSTSNDTSGGVIGATFGVYPLNLYRLMPELFGPSAWLAFLRAQGYRSLRVADFQPRVNLAETSLFLASEYAAQHGMAVPADDSIPVRTRLALEVVMHALQERAAEASGPRLVDAFLYPTHYNYYFPDAYTFFQPVADFRIDYVLKGVSDDDLAGLRNRYWNACRFLDDELDRFLGELDRRGLASHTLVVLLGDHGETFGEDGSVFHATQPHAMQFRTPLLLLGPGVAPGRIEHPTVHVDLIPLLAHFLGFEAEDVQGINPLSASRTAVLGTDISANNRLVLRRADHMSLFDVDGWNRPQWVLTLRNSYTFDEEMAALYHGQGLDRLAAIIREDRAEIFRILEGVAAPAGSMP